MAAEWVGRRMRNPLRVGFGAGPLSLAAGWSLLFGLANGIKAPEDEDGAIRRGEGASVVSGVGSRCFGSSSPRSDRGRLQDVDGGADSWGVRAKGVRNGCGRTSSSGGSSALAGGGRDAGAAGIDGCIATRSLGKSSGPRGGDFRMPSEMNISSVCRE